MTPHVIVEGQHGSVCVVRVVSEAAKDYLAAKVPPTQWVDEDCLAIHDTKVLRLVEDLRDTGFHVVGA